MILFLIIIIATIAAIFIGRLFGAWMLRIDEILKNQRELIHSINMLNNNLGNVFEAQQSETNLTRHQLLTDLENKIKRSEISQEEFDRLKNALQNL